MKSGRRKTLRLTWRSKREVRWKKKRKLFLMESK